MQIKVGSLGEHTKHRAGGGDKKIESRKLEWNVTSKVKSKKIKEDLIYQVLPDMALLAGPLKLLEGKAHRMINGKGMFII